MSACLEICASQGSNLLSAAYSHAHPYQTLCFQTRKYIDALLFFFLFFFNQTLPALNRESEEV